MRIAIAGGSGHTNYVFNALAKDPSLRVSAVSPGAPEENIDGLLKGLNDVEQSPQQYPDAEQMLSEAEADVLVTAAPLYRNAPISILGFERGLPIFGEKPLALTLDSLQAVMEAQKKANTPICAMMGLRCDPHFAAAKAAYEQGLVGDAVMITGQKSYRLGQRAAFYAQRETYGGTIPWVGIHAIDWMRWLSGKRFLEVTAYQQRLGNGGNGSMESAGAILYRMEDGVPAGVNVDFLRPAMAPTHEDDRVRVAGTQGVLEVKQHQATLLRHDAPPQELAPVDIPGGVFLRFIESLRGNGESPVPTEEGFYMTAAALIAQIAADRGRTVQFEEFGW